MIPESPIQRDSASSVALSPALAGIEAPIIQSLLCATDYGILLTDLGGTDMLCNPRFGELFGIDPQVVVRSSREEVRRMALKQIKDPAAFEAAIERLYADPLQEQEDEIVLNTDPPRILRRYTGPVFDAGGVNIGRVWTFKDVTETKRLQSEVETYATRLEAQVQQQADDLQLTTAILSAMTAISAAGAVPCDRAHLTEAITRAACLLPGLSSAALLLCGLEGRLEGILVRAPNPIQNMTFDPAQDPVLAAMPCGRIAAQNATARIITQARNSRLGSALGADTLFLAPLQWEGQRVGLLVWGATDLPTSLDTHRLDHLQAIADQVALVLETHRLQEQLRQAYDELHAAQEQLVETEKIAAIGSLAANVAHDIRNIITPLQMELALAGKSESLSAVVAQRDRLYALTHQLLALRRPLTLHTGPLDVTEVLDNSLRLIQPQADVDNVQITTDYASGLPPVQGDSGRLEHLSIGLFLFLIQSMSERGGRLAVSVAEEDSDVRIDVECTGVRLSEEQLSRLFEPFFSLRADDPGMGLFSARQIVEEHQGRIQATSHNGQGIHFSIWLPQAVEPALVHRN